MSSTSKNDKDTSSYMNNRIPRKKTASSTLITNSGSNSTTNAYSATTVSTANQPAATDTLSSFRMPRKSKDDKQQNNKKRKHDMSSIATTKVKKVKTTAKPQDNNNGSIPLSIDNVPTYQVVKEGRVSGYPIIVSQVGSEHDAILLGCNANPQEYLNNNKDGNVKIRWKFAGYNCLVPSHTVRLKVADFTPPIRKAAVLSGLLETGDELVTNKDIDLGDEEDDDAPILKAIRTELLDSSDRADKDDDYNDQEDKDEKLVCYERSASVGYTSDKSGMAAPPMDGNGSSSTTSQDGVGGQVGVVNEEISVSANQQSNDESSLTFEPQADEADTNSHKAAPSVVTSQSNIKSEDNDVDSVVTDPMNNDGAVPMAVTSDINIKTDSGEETDDDEPTPSAVVRGMIIKAELQEVPRITHETATRTCSVCEIAKDRTDFSRTQWNKGDAAKCKECICSLHYDKTGKICHPTCSRCITIRGIQDKQMETLSERQCAGCTFIIKAKYFDKQQITMEKRSVCVRCSKELVCSRCNISKDKFKHFNAAQRRRGGDVKCLDCNTRQCAHCALKKKLKGFSKDQIKTGKKAICMTCSEEKPKKQNETKLSWRQMYLSGNRA